MTKQMLLAAVLAGGMALAGCNKTPEPPKTETESGANGDVVTASSNPSVGGAEMLPTKTIVENASASPIHKQLVAAIKQAGLAETLSGPGPFTVFAPTDEAFAQLPAVQRDGWMRPAQKTVLAGILQYHVVPGKLTAADIEAKIAEGKGTATFKTADGQDLTATMSDGHILLTSASGNKAIVTQGDVNQSNGIIHVVDAVLLPKM
ncbi:fasciclin domain-containing protein [Sphingopyxis sp.]|uniref:fasciclin domain-containing protein n=1 Tax=Sphingopyxis sp. TaxID=1908224 RepID=UPI0035AF4C70